MSKTFDEKLLSIQQDYKTHKITLRQSIQALKDLIKSDVIGEDGKLRNPERKTYNIKPGTEKFEVVDTAKQSYDMGQHFLRQSQRDILEEVVDES